jgi:formamidopyrimidine-DNA glycosylase
MPELPEVETVKLQLEKALPQLGPLKALHLRRPDLRWPIPKGIAERLRAKPIEHIRRRGKYLLFRVGNGELLSHLGMSGSWRWLGPDETLRPHDHVILEFVGGERLVFHDPRRFGVLDWVESHGRHKLLDELGPEPLTHDFNDDYVWQNTRKRQVPIKSWLMNNHNVVGVGNIYASEVLFRARVSPFRKAARLKRIEVPRIVAAVKEVLQAAIIAGGSTIRDYVSSEGASGEFQSRHHVYEKSNQPCVVCAAPIKHRVLSGRSTYWCRSCQP